MKRTIYLLLITLLCSVIHAKAQTVSFSYDDDGNMTERKVLIVGASGTKASHKDTVSVVEEIGEQKIIIYPNPTKGQFQIGIKMLDKKQKNYYQLFSVSGAYLQKGNITNEYTSVDISKYIAGTYLLDIYLENRVSRWKIIKQ